MELGLSDDELAALGIDDEDVGDGFDIGAKRKKKIKAQRRYTLGIGASGAMAAAAAFNLTTGPCPYKAFRPDRLILVASQPDILVNLVTSGSVNMHMGNAAPAQGFAPNAIGTSYEGHTILAGNEVRVGGANGAVANATVSGFFAGPAIQ
jgi:hypothetical protein